MKRKNKVMAALAIGAMVLAIASGAARCALADGTGGASEAAKQPVEQAQMPEGEADASSRDEGGAAQGGFADLENTSWESEDGKSALSIIEGAFIETGDAGSSVVYYTVNDESLEGGVLTATLSTSESMTGDEEETVAVVRTLSDGATEISCDKLACKYRRVVRTGTGPVSITGATDELYELFGKDEAEFQAAIAEYAAKSSPSATSAEWGNEVWIDFGTDSYLTNFTLNDAASTIVSIRMDSSEKLGAL